MKEFKAGLGMDRNLMLCIGMALLAQMIFLGICELMPDKTTQSAPSDSNCAQPASGNSGSSSSSGSVPGGASSIPSKNFIGGKDSEKLGIKSSGMGSIGPTATLDVYGVFWPC